MREWCADGHEPLILTEARGCVLRDQYGREYLDGNSSIWTNIHGHNHPEVNAALREQLGRVAHTSFLGFSNPPAIQLAKELVDLFPGRKLSRVFYSDDGSTAIEVAARMALQYWRQSGKPARDTIIAFDRAYHGDTLGAASLGGISIFRGSADACGYRVLRVPGLDALDFLTADDLARIAAVIIEPLIQGAAGMRLWPQGMLRVLEAWCRRTDTFLIFDEVMTGFGRTGKMFACEHEGVVPDFIALAKGLTGGYLPLAATLTTERVFDGFLGDGNTFYYGHSYCGSQLGCAAALASLRVFREDHVIEKLAPKITRLAGLLAEIGKLPHVIETRQCGLIAAIDIDDATGLKTGARICLAARMHGLLTRPILNTLVLMPPLCVTTDELAAMTTALRKAITEVCG
ncbi:MAG: adenosylmethionine--8-amino-7-oxononanoate transaminase [Verrucomicrobiaceae bacterium]|nr:adenosylmethionine--8-amino-7-oxononanoate transaminase [Verrucomicrobiaceae bacterium]